MLGGQEIQDGHCMWIVSEGIKGLEKKDKVLLSRSLYGQLLNWMCTCPSGLGELEDLDFLFCPTVFSS